MLLDDVLVQVYDNDRKKHNNKNELKEVIKMKKAYVVYLDDGTETFKLNIPAENKSKALKYVEGNGQVISCLPSQDRTPENPISLDCVAKALKNASFGQMEIDLITRALHDCDFIA